MLTNIEASWFRAYAVGYKVIRIEPIRIIRSARVTRELAEGHGLGLGV